MTIKDFMEKFKSRMLWANIMAMVMVMVAIAAGFKIAIDIYTHHGESIAIPNLIHKSFERSKITLNRLGLELQVSDTGYVKSLPPGYILEQFPTPGEHVKSGHVVYVTINASHSPTITLPDVIDNCSLREAMARLTAMGFKLTPPQFVPGEKDWVYGITVNGRHVIYGDKIPVDARLTIQAGNGMRDASDSVDYVDQDFQEVYGEETDEFEEVAAPPAEETTQEQQDPSPQDTPTEQK